MGRYNTREAGWRGCGWAGLVRSGRLRFPLSLVGGGDVELAALARAGARRGNTKGTVRPSKTSMSIRWSAMLGSVYAAVIQRSREPGDENACHR